MIFDTLSILATASMFTLVSLGAYRMGKRERKRQRVKGGWAEILGYDHSERRGDDNEA
jgi:hypothetical protein